MKDSLNRFIGGLSAFVASHRQAVALFLVAFTVLGFASVCRADTDVDALVTAATTLWGTVKGLIITIAGFSLLIWVVMKIRKH